MSRERYYRKFIAGSRLFEGWLEREKNWYTGVVMETKNFLEPSLPKVSLMIIIFLLVYSFIGYCLPFEIVPKYGSKPIQNHILPCGYVSSAVGSLHTNLNSMSVWPWYTFEAFLLAASYLIACAILTGVQKSPVPSPKPKKGKSEKK